MPVPAPAQARRHNSSSASMKRIRARSNSKLSEGSHSPEILDGVTHSLEESGVASDLRPLKFIKTLTAFSFLSFAFFVFERTEGQITYVSYHEKSIFSDLVRSWGSSAAQVCVDSLLHHFQYSHGPQSCISCIYHHLFLFSDIFYRVCL